MIVSNKIPMLDLQPQIEAHWDELNAAFQRVLRSGHFILGPEEQAFEKECAAYLGVKHAVGLNSGTDALYIALRAMGIGAGDEVITTPFTFFATAEAISHVGATPVFVDIEEQSFNINPDLIDQAVTERTKAIIPVHLFGRPCKMDRIQAIANKHGLKVVEDCAQSFGAAWGGVKTGSIGAFGCYSFFPTKNLNAFGDGGLLVTGDVQLAELARMYRAHGGKNKYHNEFIGYNSRLDELQAAILRVKLPRIEQWNAKRSSIASQYCNELSMINGIVLPELVSGHVFHQFTIRIKEERRDEVVKKMLNLGINTSIYYPTPIHRLPVYQSAYVDTGFPIAELVASEVVSLPIWPEMTTEQVVAVCKALREAL